METSKFLHQFVETPKWLVIESVINSVSQNGNRIKLVICTNDGGKAAGLPRGSVTEVFTTIDVTPRVSTPFLQAVSHSKVVCCEVKLNGEPKVLRLPVGVIKAIKIDGVQLPHIFLVGPLLQMHLHTTHLRCLKVAASAFETTTSYNLRVKSFRSSKC